MSSPISELAWTMSDYLAAGQEAPWRLQQSPEACEGQLMTDGEIEQFIQDGIAAISILRNQKSNRVNQVHQDFVADLGFLLSIARLELDEYNELVDLESYSF